MPALAVAYLQRMPKKGCAPAPRTSAGPIEALAIPIGDLNMRFAP
jgi:hypothetical protein